MDQSRALVRTESMGLATLEPNNLAEAREFAKDIVESGLFPKIQTPGAALIFITTARDLGLPISAALRSLDVIPGKGGGLSISMRAELQIAKVRQDPRCVYFKCTHNPTDMECADRTYARWESAKRMPDGSIDVQTATFTTAEAHKLFQGRDGLKENWQQQFENMLLLRAATRLIKREWSDVILGLPSSEELREELEARREKENAASTVVDVPTTNAEKLGAVLANGPDALDAARAAEDLRNAKPVVSGPSPAPATSTPKEQPKPARNEEASALYNEVCGIQTVMVEKHGKDAATRAWKSERGPGSVGRLTETFDAKTLTEIKTAANRVLLALEMGEKVNRQRATIAEFDGSAPFLLDAPEQYTATQLEQMLETDHRKLVSAQKKAAITQKEKASKDREPGSEG